MGGRKSETAQPEMWLPSFCVLREWQTLPQKRELFILEDTLLGLLKCDVSP